MNYFLNLDLPLWVSIILLLLLAYYGDSYLYYKAKYQAATSEAQNELLSLKSDLLKRKEDFIAVSDRLKDKSKEVYFLKVEKVEREALIKQLNNEQDAHLSHIDELIETVGNLDQSRKELSEQNDNFTHEISKYVMHIDSMNKQIEYLQADLTAAISVINRTERGRRQWAKHEAAKKEAQQKEQRVNLIKGALQKGKEQAEIVTHDILGVPRIVLADQSEDFNARHIKELGSEVVRGIEQQNEAIKKELEGVDMSQLESGDSVKLRGGKIEVVKSVTYRGNKIYAYLVGIGDFNLFYGDDGCFNYLNSGTHKKDIIQIIKQPKFDPQVGEDICVVDYPHDEFTIKRRIGSLYLLNKKDSLMAMISRPIQDLRAVISKTYKNGYKKESDTCYKEPNKKCIFDCTGLCKDA